MTGASSTRVLGRCGRVKPVPELEALIPESLLPREFIKPIYPGSHTFELGFQNGSIPEALIEHPGDDHGCVSPGSSCHGRVHQYIWNDNRDDPLRLLLIGAQILQPGG